MTKDEIKKLILTDQLVLTDVIDTVIEINGIIGVGLISFAEDTAKYIKETNPKSKKHWSEYLND